MVDCNDLKNGADKSKKGERYEKNPARALGEAMAQAQQETPRESKNIKDNLHGGNTLAICEHDRNDFESGVR
jgi:hypothetical protein